MIQELLNEPPNKGEKVLEWREGKQDLTLTLLPDLGFLSSFSSNPLAICNTDSDCLLTGYKCKYEKCIKTETFIEELAEAGNVGAFETSDEAKEIMEDKGFKSTTD